MNEVLKSILIIIGLLILSAFFSGSEIAFNVSNKLRLKKSAENGEKIAKLAFDMSEHYSTVLCTLLIGNNLVNIYASSISTVLILHWLKSIGHDGSDGAAPLIATAVMTVVILVFGEIVPKILAKQHADRVVKWIAVPIRILSYLLFPVIIIFLGLIKLLSKLWKRESDEETPAVTEEDLSSIIDTVEEEGVIDEQKSELLQSSLEFSDTSVEEVMTPRIDGAFINLSEEAEDIRTQIDESGYSRLPVYEGDVDNIIGLLYLNTYYKETVEKDRPLSTDEIRDLLIEPCFIHKSMKLPAALNVLREKKVHLAIVIDEFGGTLGLVSMEDILEEIVGDIWDEDDEVVSEIVKTGENTYDVMAEMNIDDFCSELELRPDEDFEFEYATVGGLAIQMLNGDPHIGDSFVFDRATVVISEMNDLRITKLTVLITPPKDEEDETDKKSQSAASEPQD